MNMASRRGLVAVSVLSLLACASGSCGRAASPGKTSSAQQSLPPERWVVSENPAAPVIELRFAFDGGSADDPPGFEGLTYVTVMSMLEGRTGELSFAERKRLLFPMAAEIDAHVEREQVVISGRVHRDHWATFYPLFRDVWLKPAFDQSDFDRVRARALSSLTQDLRGADDETLGKEVLQAMLFEGHPYAHPELGSERGLAALKRQQLIEQWSRVLCAGRVRGALAGPVDAALASQVESDLAALRTAGCSEPRALPPASSLNTRRVWIIDKPEAGSVAISIGVPIAVTRAHPDYAALSLAAAYLGQHRTFAGRLMKKMRGDRGLNYGDYAYAEHFVQEDDTRFPMPNVSRRQQYFSVWLRPVRPEQARFALRMALRELELFEREGLSEADFARMQRFAARYFSLFAQTEQQRLGNALDDRFYGTKEPHLASLTAAFGKLTREQVNAAIRRHVASSRLQIAMVAPHADALAESLVRGDASPITYNVDKPADVLAEDKLIEKHPLGLLREQVNVLPLASIFR
ncbi:MAG: Peptidase, family [Myxococcaceae bacterium]|nr:Peptidase, family [Myxococcaceae bacterium]